MIFRSAELAKYRRQQVEADVEIQAFKAEKETKAKQREQEIKNVRKWNKNYHDISHIFMYFLGP